MCREKIKIQRNKPCILLEGEGSGVTKITYDDHQSTDTSATFSSFADNVVAKGITFEVKGSMPLLKTLLPSSRNVLTFFFVLILNFFFFYTYKSIQMKITKSLSEIVNFLL